nr:immunoglobulin heavy chain junction region [Macaca mulatta]MOV36792.1 immunoglobulin heavy chain junction region [Macaca mulatta]
CARDSGPTSPPLDSW